MSLKSKSLSLKRQLIEDFVFFFIFFLCLWLVVDLRFVTSSGGIIAKFPVFYRDWDFLNKTCAFPGGPVEYLSSFLAQFFYFSWAGALIVTLQAWLIYFFTKKFLNCLKMSAFFRTSFITPVIILALYNKYIYFLNISLGILIALVAAYVYSLFADKKKVMPSILLFLSISVFLYPIAGAAILMFGVLCIIYELIFRSRFLLAGIELLSVFIIVFVLGIGIYQIGNIEAFTRLLPIHSNFEYIYRENDVMTALACCLYLFLPIMLILLWLFRKIPRSDFFNLQRDDTQFLILLVLSSLAIYFTYDSKKKNFYAADYYANQRNWSKAAQASKLAIDHPLMVCTLDRALYHMGRFPQEIFSFPQQQIGPFYAIAISPLHDSGICQATDLCIDLGLISHAEQFAWQKFEIYGPNPLLLKRLAIIMMVKGDIDSTRIYLNKLGKTLFHAKWAQRYLVKLDTDPDLLKDEYIQHLRRIMLKTDFIVGKSPGGGSFPLVKLLETNRHNKMAFEYLMAKYLLEKHPRGVVENLYRLGDFKYKETPAVFEDAIFLCLIQNGAVKIPEGFRISSESRQRFNKFDKFLRGNKGNLPALENEVTINFKNTYYEYFFYGYKSGLSGGIK